MMRIARSGLAAAAVVALMAGCSSVKLDDKLPPVETAKQTPVNPAGQGGSAAGTSQSQVASVDLTKGPLAAQGNLPRVVYFDFDSYVVKDEYRPTLEAHAKLLSADRKKKLAVEGHTDERGGREYNLALGQKRAESVVKQLELLGVNDNQLEAVSFGKERPAVQGSDEAAWAKNRRAELVNR
ncbi:MAG TPA: peptidoglycan-associated lipoprotein Pal [Albitalea sp.]|nr:peptidoglycan-associated lipoprotein Pal [Albitalea sp.]